MVELVDLGLRPLPPPPPPPTLAQFHPNGVMDGDSAWEGEAVFVNAENLRHLCSQD